MTTHSRAARRAHTWWRWLAAPVLGLMLQLAVAAEPKVGVFYFPGWKDNALGLAYNPPWEPIKRFPDREPVLGWYPEGEQWVMDKHLGWMQQNGLDYVLFSWYWSRNFEILGHAVQAYQRSKVDAKIPYALMWANHDRGPVERVHFTGMVRELIKKHWNRPDYLRVDGRPVFFIMLPDSLQQRAAAFSTDSVALLQEAQAMVREAGLPPILFVGGSGGGAGGVTNNAKRWGYAGYFIYNYHAGIGNRIGGEVRFSRSYAELDAAYREHWDWFMTQGDLPYVLPMTAGWDKRPWGGSKDPLHDNSWPRKGEFEAHLKAAKERMLRHPDKVLGGLGVVCCWNEFGEGSIVEPTKALGFQRLDAVQSVFGR
ncbi:MAG: glycoside hydrolase family 99-like domain-containing protein [Rubrivivax sp.]|nr:glycoside hydrolase family 99-like domain-containing protein [Rubrivivax sp.]